MTYISSSFIASFTPKKLDSSDQRLSRTTFREVAQADPDLSLETNRFTVHLSKSSSTRVASSHDGQVTLLLHGEIYTAGNIPANYLLERYLDEGLEFAKDVNGSFAILLVDKRTDQVALITDRLNYREVFTSKYKGSHWLSTALTYHLHPVDDLKLDPVGIAFYLTNRMIPNDRTLFAGIRALERACVHTFTDDGFQQKKYWSYDLNESRSGVDEKTLQADLSDLLTEGVRKRLADNPKVFLSLSAGYDSTSILGLLHKLQVPDVECFSYANGDPEPDSDPYIARNMAHQLGYNHTVVPGYQDELPEMLNSNAELGQGLAAIIHEVDAWKELSKWFSSTPQGALFVGEILMGGRHRNRPLKSDLDIIREIYRDINGAPWLGRFLPYEHYTALEHAMSQGYSEFINRCPPTDDYHKKRTFLSLDQAHRKLYAFREHFSGPFINVRSPLLDNDIIEFMMTVPMSLKHNYRLYRSTVRKMFPDLFKFKRATTSGFSEYSWERAALSVHHSEIEDFVSNQGSLLDELIPPDVILDLLREQRASIVLTSRGVRRKVRSSRLKVLNSSIGKWVICKFPGTRGSQLRIRQATFLTSALCIRLFLHNRLRRRSTSRSAAVV